MKINTTLTTLKYERQEVHGNRFSLGYTRYPKKNAELELELQKNREIKEQRAKLEENATLVLAAFYGDQNTAFSVLPKDLMLHILKLALVRQQQELKESK